MGIARLQNAAGAQAGQHGQTQIGIYSETDRLQTAAVWGKPGIEAVLAQMHPTDVSLFLDHMDVIKGAVEMETFTNLLRRSGVEITVVRDKLAEIMAPTSELSERQVLQALFDKVDAIRNVYGSNGMKRDETRDLISHLLGLDIARYGMQNALTLTNVLSLNYALPLGDMLYARDQTNVLLGERIVASMAETIRRPEVRLYELVYRGVLGLANPITIPEGEKFEGGDAYVHNGVVYIGVGPRTSEGAALHIFKALHDRGYTDFRFAMVKNGKTSGSFSEIQESMHLDTFSMPIGPKQVALCEAEAEHRHVYMAEFDKQGKPVLVPTGKSLIEFFKSEGYSVTMVTKSEQMQFGSNILMLDGETAFIPISPDSNIVSQLRGQGKKVEFVDLQEITNGFGATHCAVAQLRRE